MKRVAFGLIQLGFLGWMSMGAGGCDPGPPVWYTIFHNACSNAPTAGCDYYADGHKISSWEDPYFNSNFYKEEYGTWVYQNDFSGRWEAYTGWVWNSPDGIIYDMDGRALNGSNDENESRDLIGSAAEREARIVSVAGKDFAHRYALTESTGIHLARTLNAWATLPKLRSSRERTDQDLADFSRRLFGVNADKVRKTLASGDSSGLREVNSEIATYWGTTPETSEAVLREWFKGDLRGK